MELVIFNYCNFQGTHIQIYENLSTQMAFHCVFKKTYLSQFSTAYMYLIHNVNWTVPLSDSITVAYPKMKNGSHKLLTALTWIR